MTRHPFTFAALLILPCFALTSCNETKVMKKQLGENSEKIRILQEEATAMETQMIALRKLVPANLASEAMIKDYSAKLALKVVGIENEITQAKTSLLQAADQLDQAKKDLETLQNLSTR